MKIDWSFVFEWGFRPFFVLASIFMIGSLVYWLVVLKGIVYTPDAISPRDWHAHEMVFGFGAAALSGFLLTAIPSWTNTPHVHGRTLMDLVGLWVLGRVLVAVSDFVPMALVISVNLAFPLYLGYLTCAPLWRDLYRKHTVFVFVISLFLSAQILTYLGWIGGIGEGYELSRLGLYGGMYALIYAIVVTSTRISMVVVRHALDEQGDTESLFRPYPFRRNLAATTFLIFACGDILIPQTSILGWLAFAAGAAQLDRLSDFHVGKVLLKPYVLLVYCANLWIGLGCIAMGLDAFFDLNGASDIRHIFAIGAMTTAILSVFTIAGLRHSGHDLIVPRRISLALMCLVIAVLLRELPLISAWDIPESLYWDAAVFCTVLVFVLYLTKFFKILCCRNDETK